MWALIGVQSDRCDFYSFRITPADRMCQVAA
jgi:hypothetical protein